MHTLFLIPGFMSPAWMLYPMQRYLSSDFDKVIRWDYPRIFGDLDNVTDSLAELIDRTDGTVSLVAHSFGDWISRSALGKTRHEVFSKLVSVSPVTTAVPIVEGTKFVSARLASELAVMADPRLAEVQIPDHVEIDRHVIWTHAEVLVRTEVKDARVMNERTVWASHNSVLFQPNGWKAIRQELLSERS